MAYVKQTWTNLGASNGLGATSEVNAERLGHIEDGIDAAQTAADAVAGDLATLTPDASTVVVDVGLGLGPDVQAALGQLDARIAAVEAGDVTLL